MYMYMYMYMYGHGDILMKIYKHYMWFHNLVYLTVGMPPIHYTYYAEAKG